MILFWIAIITFTAPNGDEALVASKQKSSHAECTEMVSGEIGKLMQQAIEESGQTVTGAYCIPVTEEHREPMVGGAQI